MYRVDDYVYGHRPICVLGVFSITARVNASYGNCVLEGFYATRSS